MKSWMIGIVLAAALGARAETFEAVTGELFPTAPGKGGGAAWADLNRDGYPDLVADGRIFRNDGGRTFHDVTGEVAAHGTAVAADFNGDGHLDLFFPMAGRYYLGDGAFHFTPGEVEAPPHLMSLGASAADFDNDGWVDLYVSGYEIWEQNVSFPDYLYRNDNGVLKLHWQTAPEQTMRCHGGVSACDFDENGKIDVYVGNYRLQPNQLWVNQGNLEFRDEARARGVAGTERADVTFATENGVSYGSSGHTIGVNWGDFDNDGRFDLFVCNFSHPPEYQDRPQFLHNAGAAGEYRFLDRSADAALRWQESYAGSAAGDYDNDGRLDLFLTTAYDGDRGVLLHNDGDWHFSEDTGVIHSVTNCQAAWADFDRDGHLDLFTGGELYRNRGAATGDALQVALYAPGLPNSAAVGAVVTCVGADGRTQVRQVEAGTGAGSQNDATLYFGLGSGAAPVVLTVRWPDGIVQRIDGPALNQVLALRHPGVAAARTEAEK